jgi:hypothetical protein
MPTIITRGAASALAYGWSRLSGAVKDAYFKYVTILLPGNGTNGAQNNTFLDSSTNNFTITRNGNTTQGTFTPYGDNWSYNSTANGNYLTVAQNTAFAFGTGNFTIEAWIFRTDVSAQRIIVDTRGAGGGAVGVMFYVTTQGYLTVFDGTGTVIGGSVATITTNNAWSHVAVTRSGTTTTLWINGTSVATATDTRNYANGASGTYVGRQFGSTSNDWIGYLSNVRVVKGTAVYTANFTPPTTPLTAISGTSLLTCQSNRFIDNSGNSFALTITGTPSVQRFSPFNPTASYVSETIGGSAFFDGNGDYLQSSGSVNWSANSAITVDYWVYPTTLNGSSTTAYAIFGTSSNTNDNYTFSYIYGNGRVAVGINGVNEIVSAANVIRAGVWSYVSVVRNGSTTTIYVNGTSVASNTTGVWSNNSAAVRIGFGPPNTYFNGYLSDLRIVLGSSNVPSTNPTSPLTSITNTNTLLSFTNAGLLDNSMINDFETVGSAQISTTQSKFGGSSISFNGSNSSLTVPSSQNYDFGTGDFTVELWAYFNGLSTQNFIISEGTGINGSGPLATSGWSLNYSSNNLRFEKYDGTTQTTYTFSWTPSTGVWYHIAVSRSGTSLRAFINGTQIGTTQTSSLSFNRANTTEPLTVGFGYAAGSGWYLNAYLDDIRVTKGYARYTANFTAPTAAFPTS